MTKDNYNISKEKYYELKYFCLQFDSKKEKLKSICVISAVRTEETPCSTSISNPTATQGEIIAQLSKDIELIEQTAIQADSEFYKYILDNVTKGTPYEYLDIPMSRRSFYRLRRKYFYLLSIKK